jgi:glutathione S-transferase
MVFDVHRPLRADRTGVDPGGGRPPLAEMSMKVHFESNTNASLPLLLFLTEHDTVEIVTVGLAKSEGMGWEHVALDPSKCVPILEHGDFVLTKCPAILKYLEAPPVPGPRLPQKATSRLGRLASLGAAAVVGAGIASGAAMLMQASAKQDSGAVAADGRESTLTQGRDLAQLFASLKSRGSVGPMPRILIEDRRSVVDQPSSIGP